MTRLELGIAWRYLRSRRGSRLLSFISVIAIGGVLVGVSALIVIIGVMNGLQRDLREKILVGSPDIRVTTYGDDLRMADWRGALAKVKAVPGIVSAAPFVQSTALVSAGHDYAEPAQVVGIPASGPGVPNVTAIREHAVQGDFTFKSANGGRRGVVIGEYMAARLDAYPGDTLRLIAPPAGARGVQLSAGLTQVPRFFAFEVTGVFKTGMYEYDNTYIYMELAAAAEVAGLGDAVTGVEVKTADRWQSDVVSRRLEQSLGWPYHTMDWQEQNRSLFQALKLEKLGMSIILLLIVVVAAFNIVSTLTMVVTDKTREIGILKAMGMPAGAIRRIFVAQGLVIGMVGTGLGLLVGLAAAVALDRFKLIALDPTVYFIDHLPVATEPMDVVLIVVSSVAIAMVATIYPASQAAKLYPVEAIRHE